MTNPSRSVCFVQAGVLACLLAGACLKVGCCQETPKEATPVQVTNPKLREELLRRVQEDQAARMAVIEWMKKSGTTDFAKPKQANIPEITRMEEVDKANLAWIKTTIADVGWPGFRMVGQDGANAAWLLLQHADSDRSFQRRCLKLMEAAAKKGDASKSDLAYLVDRVLVGEGKKQRYGTQMHEVKGQLAPYPIADEKNVDKRRAALGLPTMAEYARMMKQMYQGQGK